MKTSDGAPILGTWTTAAYALVALLAVAGVYLIDPAAIDLGFELEVERTAIVGVFLVAAAASMAFALSAPTVSSGNTIVDLVVNLFLKFIIGYLTLFVFAIIELVLGIRGLFASPPNFWAAALLIPSVLSIVLAFATIGELGGKPTEADDKDENDGETEGAVEATTAWSGKLFAGATMRFSLIYTVYYTVAMFALMVSMWFGYWLYYRLDGAIFRGETLDAASAMASLSDLASRMWPTALGLSALIAAMIFVLTAGGTLLQWISQRGVPGANRDLSPAEADFIDASAERVRAYAHAQGFDRNVWLVQLFSVVAVIASIAAAIGAFIAIAALIAPPPPGPSFPIVIDSSLSVILWVFVGVLLCPLVHSILTRLSRSYSERTGWVAIGEKNDYFTLTGKLTSFVRNRRLSTQAEINPGAFLHDANLSFERYFYVPAAMLTVLALFFSHRDFASADTLTADHVEVVDYWTLEHRRYRYGDVAQVVVRCYLGDKKGTVEGYELQFKDGSALDIYSQSSVEAQLAAYEAVDAKLKALGVPFVPGAHNGWSRSEDRGYDSDCVETVAKGLPASDADRMRRLFHLDTLKAVAVIWPWDAELGAARAASDAYDVQKAVALYTKAIESGRLTGHMLGVAYSARGDARDAFEVAYGMRDSEMLLALRDYQKASKIEPTMWGYVDEALTFAALGAYDEALAAYQKALALDRPKPHWSLIGLARIERARGRYDEAMRYLDQVLRVWGEDDASMGIYYQRGRVLYLKGDNAGVVDAITKGLAYEAEDARALRYRACAHARLSAFDRAKDDIARAIKFAHVPPTDPAWEMTPQAKAYYAEFASDRAIIDAMAAGAARDDDRAKLCADLWRTRDTPRARSPLLP